MLISTLKYIKIFKGTPTCFDLNRSSSGSRSVPKLMDYLKNTELKILTINPGTPATCIAATTPGLIVRILNSVFFK